MRLINAVLHVLLCVFVCVCPAAAVDAIVRGGFDLTRVNVRCVYGRGHYFAGALLPHHSRRPLLINLLAQLDQPVIFS